MHRFLRRLACAGVTLAAALSAGACDSSGPGTDDLAGEVDLSGATSDAAVDLSIPDAPVPPDLLGADLLALSFIDIAPQSGTVAVGATLPLKATGHYNNGTVQDVTGLASWASAQPTIVKVSDAAGTKGVATGISSGGTDVYAVYGGQGATAHVTVPVPTVTVTKIVVSPSTASIAVGSTKQFTATATYSNATSGDVTHLAAWFSDAIAVATVSNAGGNEGLATGQAAGVAHIIASFGGVTGQGTLTVTSSTPSPVGITGCTAANAATFCPGPAGNRYCITTWGSGYCTVDCSPGDGGTNFMCPTGSTCYEIGPNNAPPRWYCLRDCGGTPDCAAGSNTTCFFSTTSADGGVGKGACLNPN